MEANTQEATTPLQEVANTGDEATKAEETSGADSTVVASPVIAASTDTAQADTAVIDDVGTTDESEQNVPPVRVVPNAQDYALPEGVPTEFADMANKLDYTQEQLEGSLTAFGGYVNAMSEAEKAANIEAYNTFTKDMPEEKLSAFQANAKAGLAYIDEDGEILKKLTGGNGFDFDPHILRGLAKVGEMLKEGTFVAGGVNKPRPNDTQSRAHRMFPNDVPKN